MAVNSVLNLPQTRSFLARDLALSLDRGPLLMGVLNVTPDSFSDGGLHEGSAAFQRARILYDEGAHILDIGGESTRPGSSPVGTEDELARILPVIGTIRAEMAIPISVDTTKAAVATQALAAGAHIINDVWGFQRDAGMAALASDTGAGVILMHNREHVDAGIDIMREVTDFLRRSIDLALDAGVKPQRIAIDPGIGFGKTHEQSAEMIRRLAELKSLGFPILLGASRKRFIGMLTGVENPRERVYGTIAAHLAGVLAGADIVRAHDIRAHSEALSVLAAVRSKPS